MYGLIKTDYGYSIGTIFRSKDVREQYIMRASSDSWRGEHSVFDPDAFSSWCSTRDIKAVCFFSLPESLKNGDTRAGLSNLFLVLSHPLKVFRFITYTNRKLKEGGSLTRKSEFLKEKRKGKRIASLAKARYIDLER